MNLAKVWNDNELPFEQKFKDQVIHIPPHDYIEMEYTEAHSFLGAPFAMKFDGMGQQTKDSYKMLRVEGKPDTDNQVTAFKCHADGSLHASKDALNSYVQKNFSVGLEASKEAVELGIPVRRNPGRPKKEV